MMEGRILLRMRRRAASHGGRVPPSIAGSCKVCLRVGMPFWAIGYQALASQSKAVQLSPTIIFGGLTLTGFTGRAGLFFDN